MDPSSKKDVSEGDGKSWEISPKLYFSDTGLGTVVALWALEGEYFSS